MDLKGAVRSVVSESKAISGYAEWVLNDKTTYRKTENFDRAGNLTESLSEGQSTTRYVYSLVEGNKSFRMIEMKPSQSTLRVTIDSDKTPIEADEKLTARDPSFDFKYVYDIENNGRTITERQFNDQGRLFRKRIYEYGSDGKLVKMFHEDRVAKEEYSYRYDNRGILIAENRTRDIKVAGADSKEKISYTDLKLDSVGNWIERKITIKTKVDAVPQYNIPKQENTLVSVENRIITYY